MSVVIARGGVDDLPAIMPVMTRAFSPQFGEAWTESQCLGVLAMPGSELMVARDGDLVGFALSRTIVGECELMLLAVAPESQQNGVGRALLSTMISNARSCGARMIFLEVRQGNPAITLYSFVGFAEVGRRRGYYRGSNGESFDALTYRLALS